MESVKEKRRFCGNCINHNPYEYPKTIFCSKRYAQTKEPIAETLGCCNDWSQVNQDCHCVRDALKEKEQCMKQR
jgi:hypothetical protein